MDVARLNFSHGNREIHAENAERVRAAAARAGRQVAILQDLPGPKIRIGSARGRDRRAEARRDAGPGVRQRRRRRRAADLGQLARPRRRGRPRRRDLPRRRRDPAARAGDPRRRRRARDRRRDRRIGGVSAGPQHPGLDARAARGARGGPRHAAVRRIDRRGCGRAVVRADRRGRDERSPAHPAPAGRQDREAAGGRCGRGDHPRSRLRDGRPRRPRDRAADRRGPDRAEAAARAGRAARAPLDHRYPDARLDGRLVATRPAPRWPTSPTRSSTARTR